MFGRPSPFRPRGGGRGVPQPPHQQQSHLNPNFANVNPFFFQQNPGLLPQIPFPQNPTTLNHIQRSGENNTSQTFLPDEYNNNRQSPQKDVNVKKMIQKLDEAVVKAWADLLSRNENVTACKVSQAALLTVNADSFKSLDLFMQQVQSLKTLLATEGRINTFIYCFVMARRITSLYDLEVAVCENEGIERFEELELGPLLKHPLAIRYFSLTSDVTEVYRIRTEDILSYLCEFIDIHGEKTVNVATFLKFITKKKSISGRMENLCLSIQDLEVYIKHIKQARHLENRVLEKCQDKMRTTYVKRSQIPPHFTAQKGEMDNNFSAISERMKSFNETHIRSVSSSSEDDCSEADEYASSDNFNLASPNVKPERVTNCPYPSATEEITRLGLHNEVDSRTCTLSGVVRRNANNELSQRKRRNEHMSSSISSPFKRRKTPKSKANLKHKYLDDEGPSGSQFTKSLRMFVTTWKEACQTKSVHEVLERMLEFYNAKKTDKVKRMFISYPFVGLLHFAVTGIKLGMFDHMHDAFQNFIQPEIDQKPLESSADYISISKPANMVLLASAPNVSTHVNAVAAEDIVNKISGYLEDDISSYKNSPQLYRLRFLRRLFKCEYWLMEQYSVNKFESLGHGEYFVFLEKYMRLLPHALRNCMIGDGPEDVSLEAHLLPIQLNMFMSQAVDSVLGNETMNLQTISELLARQFPLVCLKLVNGDLANLPDIKQKKGHYLSSTSLLFSTSLLKLKCLSNFPAQTEKKLDESVHFSIDTITTEEKIAAVTTKDAIDALIKAPMLTDLILWLHWGNVFAPSLGSFVEWLLKEVNTKELLCLITKDGKVVRVDHSTTPDSILKALMRGSAFETAVALLSLCALYGGEGNIPLSLLKCHAQRGFEVLYSSYLDKESQKDKYPILHENLSDDQCIVGQQSSKFFRNLLPGDNSKLGKASSVMARFILDCLSYLPIEFCSFAADVLISGLQSFVKDVPAVILNECKRIEQRLMLHEVGLSLGLVEWVTDYHSFRSSASAGFSLGSSCLDVINSENHARFSFGMEELDKHPSSSGEIPVSRGEVSSDLKGEQLRGDTNYPEVPADGETAKLELSSLINDHNDEEPVRVIESIRLEEFGLNKNLSAIENQMLDKQHARLGRALHCLSQELYSQDSHFILELIQNADDNIYSGNVEPTLVFILQEQGIIVLNNEHGFSAKDIRALCDVGNSTKKGQNTGYIGKKGIGFKSVFRVTDAPEIHSNGFHIKFDITKGQIGFVLPTVIPPCDIGLYTRWASDNVNHIEPNCWNTCVVLPFRSNLLEGFSMNNILSMFSDLHPSLLLFLHRLQCIKFRSILDDSIIVMRKEVKGDGIVEVALGNEKMTWFVVSHNLKANTIRSEVQSTEISIAFTLQETGEGGYIPILHQQPVFAFLPLRTYGLKFILQGDFVLPSSREEVDGDSPWNQWLLSEFPNLFINAEKLFCDLPCYRESPGKAITVFMSFIPLVGEVHGFFSSLPRMIIGKLRSSNCLVLEGDEKEWVPPCKVLRNWTDETRALLPDTLLDYHLGLGYLDKDIILPDSLANALGVEDYGPKLLLKVISSLCQSDNGLKSMGLGWLSSWLSAAYVVLSHSILQTSQGLGTESDFILNLQKIPFIPLSDDKYSSLDEGTIWLHSEMVGECITDECLLKAFPKLYDKLRIVSPNLLAAASSIESSLSDLTVENVKRMLCKIGVQQLSLHDIMKVHILPKISDDNCPAEHEELMIEYLAFAMFHLQSNCTSCSLERAGIISNLCEKALILTNYGFKRLNEVPIHFNQEYGSPVDVNKLIGDLDIKWHELHTAYLEHPITKSISGGMMGWKRFFQEIGITDFLKVVEVGNCVPDTTLSNHGVSCTKNMPSTDSVSKNWESKELFQLLSCICSRNDASKSKYLLQILDTLWDQCFSDKVAGCIINSKGESKLFKSSFISILQDFPWVASNVNDKLNFPKDLFHDCTEIKSIFGVNCPYTVPKVISEKLRIDIGFKTQATLEDALSVLGLWRRSETPLEASISQMYNFYSFLRKEMSHAKKQVMEELELGPFIFIPKTASFIDGEAVPGILLSPQEVYWHDSIGSSLHKKFAHRECFISSPYRKMLDIYYPDLHDFFVNECGVAETPPLRSYLRTLLQLSTAALPHQASKEVFETFLMWDEGLKSGSLSFTDAEYLKEKLLKKKYTILPTRLDKWASLHTSFGLICWCDDDDLGMEFSNLGGINFLYFGESPDGENQKLQAKVLTIMKRLGIPALSEIVTRKAICNSLADCHFMSTLVNWVLPYAQRYIYSVHVDKYLHLKQSGFQSLTNLKIAVVENLSYQNVIKKCGIVSTKKHDCNCLVQDNILYCSKESDPHSVFLELSYLLYDGTPDLHFANFLHMITTMAESGATEEQTEFFILNSQKVPQLPAEESCWCLQSLDALLKAQPSEHNTLSKRKRKRSIQSNWPPVGWKSAPGFDSVRELRFKNSGEDDLQNKSVECNLNASSSAEVSTEVNIEVDPTAVTQVVVLDDEFPEPTAVTQVVVLDDEFPEPTAVTQVVVLGDEFPEPESNISSTKNITTPFPSNFNHRDQASGKQAFITGRLGEHVAYNYFVENSGETTVKWVNETNESGLPYDIVIGNTEYIEVKATKSGKKNWFLITMSEWLFALEKGESFSIAHVVIAENGTARVSVYKNPARLCRIGNLRLAIVVPNQ